MSVKLFQSLLYKSAQLDETIEREQKRPLPDRFRLIRLKKLRLAIKDRLHRLIMDRQSSRLVPVRIRSNRLNSI
jgi:uncharacterized protein YdcH (DUF465 family)